jgi:uncharacterized repeat protein (TIGR03803 family)
MTPPAAPGAAIVALYTFSDGVDGATPESGLIQAPSGVCYGTTINGGSNGPIRAGTIFKVTTNGVLTPLYTLTEGANNSGLPYAGLALAANGILYGDGQYGGTNNNGSVFKITTNGAFTELYGFTQVRGGDLTNTDGANPTATLVLGTNGNFYGTAPNGGSNGVGAIFEITTNGALTRLHSFTNGSDGANPGALFQSSNGLIYGTANTGGANGNGTIFKMTAAGQLTAMYSFSNGVDGGYPGPALVQGANGILYGTAGAGGSNSSGVIFQITTNGAFTPLYSFAPSGSSGLGTTNADGLNPGALLVTPNGTIYGFGRAGGLNGTGTLFQFSPTAGLTLLYTFLTGPAGANGVTNAVGANPTGIMLGSDGTLYGTAKYGGSNGYGVVFQMGLPPQITSQPTNCSVALGGNAVFSISASVPACQWQLNGVDIPRATNLALTNLNVQITNAGPYQAVVSNTYGSVTSLVANLNITNVPVLFETGPGDLQYGGGQFSLLLTNLTGQGSVIIDLSTNLPEWTPVFTNPPSFGQFQFMDSSAAANPCGFYRARFIPGQ